MAKKNLQLTVGIYDQPQLDKDGNFDPLKGELTRRRKGEVFEAQSDAEYDRLLSFGAAIDPDKAAEAEVASLRARLEELEAERASTEAQIAANEAKASEDAASLDPEELKGKDLDNALTERGLSKEGTAEEKRARLSEALKPTPTWA